MEVASMIGFDLQSIYHFGFLLFSAFSDLTTKVNSYDDLKTHWLSFIKSTAGVT